MDLFSYLLAKKGGSGEDISNYFYASPPTMSYQSKIGAIIKKVPRFTLPNTVNNLSNLFNGCILESVDLSGIDFTRITSAPYMFSYSEIENFIGLDNLLTNNISNMGFMFNSANITNFDFTKLDTSKCTSMTNMFNNASGVSSLNLTSFNVSNVTNMTNIFANSENSTILEIDISTWDMSKVNNIDGMFNSPKLEILKFGNNFGKGFTTSGITFVLSTTSLNHDSLMSVINNLYDLTLNNRTANLQLGSVLLAKLTTEEIQIATAKGWNVS